MFSLLNDLHRREITGHIAIESIALFLQSNNDTVNQTLSYILDKDINA
jgi:hypothetical protein